VETNRRFVFIVAAVAVVIAAGAGIAYLMTASFIALRVLWLAGPIALTAAGFALLQAWLPRDGP
jgi:hypothetical protein